jgi:hypothetical protein
MKQAGRVSDSSGFRNCGEVEERCRQRPRGYFIAMAGWAEGTNSRRSILSPQTEQEHGWADHVCRSPDQSEYHFQHDDENEET